MQSTYYSSAFILNSSSHPKSRAESHLNTYSTCSRAEKCSRNIRTTQIVDVWPKFAWQPSHSAQSSHALSSWQRSLVTLHVTKCTSTNNSWKPSPYVGSYTVLTGLGYVFQLQESSFVRRNQKHRIILDNNHTSPSTPPPVIWRKRQFYLSKWYYHTMHVACIHKPFQTLIHILTCMVGEDSAKTVPANYAVSIENKLSLKNPFDLGGGGVMNLFIWLSKTRNITDFCWGKNDFTPLTRWC